MGPRAFVCMPRKGRRFGGHAHLPLPAECEWGLFANTGRIKVDISFHNRTMPRRKRACLSTTKTIRRKRLKYQATTPNAARIFRKVSDTRCLKRESLVRQILQTIDHNLHNEYPRPI